MPVAVTVAVEIALFGEAFTARAFVGFGVTLTVTAGRCVKKSGIIAMERGLLQITGSAKGLIALSAMRPRIHNRFLIRRWPGCSLL